MPINHNYKTIFIHIPKTAGTSLEYALKMHGDNSNIGKEPYINQKENVELLFGNGLQHLSAKRVKSIVGSSIFNSYFKFSIVRNPYDRLVSYVAWLNRKWYDKKELSEEEFDMFINKKTSSLIKKQPLPIPQYKYLYNRRKCLVDRIIKFENLTNDLISLKKILDVDFQLDKRMKSYHKDYKQYYNEKLIKTVNKFYAKDFILFDYNTSIE